MKITLEALKALETIERCGSFALAAKELHRVPSALTYTIKNLEMVFEAPLFDREGHRAKLTPLGKHILQEGKKLLLAADRFEKNMAFFQSGWEQTLTIAYDQLIPFHNLEFLIEDFYKIAPPIELKFSAEVLGGCWDALIANRVMLSIGVTGEPPVREDISVMHLGEVEFVFLVASKHPLAKTKEKITNDQLLNYKSIVVADTSLGYLPRTSGILADQQKITVSHFHDKIALMLKGIGIGYLPLTLAKPYIDEGSLVVKKVEKLKSIGSLATAWRPSTVGKATQWFINKLSDKKLCQRILK